MTLGRFPLRAGLLKRRPELDDEARRAHEALERVRRFQHGPGAAPEWRALARRRTLRRVRVGVGIAAALLVTAGLAAGGWFGGRALFAWVRHDTDLLAVQSIEVTGLRRLARAELLAEAGLAVGQDLLTVRPEEAAARLALLPLVRSAQVRRTWERRLLVTIVERQPRALVLTDRLAEVDEEGVVLPPPGTDGVPDLPIIRGLETPLPPPGQRLVAAGLDGALHLAGLLADSTLGLESLVSDILVAEPDSLVMFLMPDGIPVKVGRGDVTPRRLAAFRAVLEANREQKHELEYVDLRFSKQVVVKRKPEPEETKEISPPEPRKTGAAPRGAAPKGRGKRHGRNT